MNRIQYLRLVSISGALLVGFWLPVRLIGFIPPMSLEILFDLMISLISVINIHLYFHDSGHNPRQPRAWLRLTLWLDLICLLPLSLLAFVVFDRTIAALLLFNLLAARHIRHIRPFLDYFPALQPIVYRVVPLLIALPLLVHLVACGWIALGSGTAGNDPDALLTYVRAVYWSFTTLTTVGYGDIAAKTIPQMLYACGVQVTGVGVFGFILSNVASLLARSDAAREHHMDNLDKIETFMKLHHIPQELKSSIRAYYHYMWTHKKGYRDTTLLDDLPAKIQSELFLHLNKPILEKVPFFRGAERELIVELMSCLTPRIYVPGEKIFKIDDVGDALYFIQHGEVEILSRDGSLIATLSEGSCFGEMALIDSKPRAATAKASDFCDIYILLKHDFERVTTAYPDFRHQIEKVMAARQGGVQ